MGKLTPYLVSENARAQAEFYNQSLGGEVLLVNTHEQLMGAQHPLKDKVMHLSMTIAGDNALFMSDSFDPNEDHPGISLAMEFETESEASEAFAKLAAGGTVTHPIQMQPFGLFYGDLVDKFGVRWMITAEPKTRQNV